MTDASPLPEPNWILTSIQGTTAVPRSVAKLIATVGGQVALFPESIPIRRDGQADPDVSFAGTEPRSEGAVVRLEDKLAIRDIEGRTEERVRRQEAKRQENLETIIAQAARELPESVSDQPVDEDWVAQFFVHCQDICNEQMQLLWARLLAGEVANPGSFSLRTLAFTRTLSRNDADLFTRFCSLLWQTGPTAADLRPLIQDLDNLQSIPGIQLGLDDFVRLDSLGLIRFEAFVNFSVKYDLNNLSEGSSRPSHLEIPWYYYGRLHVISKPDVAQNDQILNLEIGKALLTDIGREMAPISGSTPNEANRQLAVSGLRQRGWDVAEH